MIIFGKCVFACLHAPEIEANKPKVAEQLDANANLETNDTVPQISFTRRLLEKNV